jgi:ribose 5-phosphate isomerase A
MAKDHQTLQMYKKQVARKALDYVKEDIVLGIGTGSTVECFIHELAQSPIRHQIKFCVSSSNKSSELLKNLGFELQDANQAHQIDVYIDGADEINPLMQMIKGGGGALTQEKILSSMSKKFVCIVDYSKYVQALGDFPLPVEVIPMARSFVAHELVKLGGQPEWRKDYHTDNGHLILDVHIPIKEPIALEQVINNIPGVVSCGLFARRPADVVLIAGPDGMTIQDKPLVSI